MSAFLFFVRSKLTLALTADFCEFFHVGIGLGLFFFVFTKVKEDGGTRLCPRRGLGRSFLHHLCDWYTSLSHKGSHPHRKRLCGVLLPTEDAVVLVEDGVVSWISLVCLHPDGVLERQFVPPEIQWGDSYLHPQTTGW